MPFRLYNPKMIARPTQSFRRIYLTAAFFLTVAGIAGFSPLMHAQDGPHPSDAKPVVDAVVQRDIDDWVLQGRGVADDWTHHHLVFSNPGTEQQAIENGNYEQWLKIVNDPRFTVQQIKRSGGVKAVEDADGSTGGAPDAEVSKSAPKDRRLPLPGPKANFKKDWNMAIGGVAASATGTVNTNNATGGNSTVSVDGVTLTASAPTVSTVTGAFTGAPGAGQSVTITNGSNALSLLTNATTSTAIGTVSAAPTSTIAPTITVTNSAGSNPNTLSLATNATGPTATGTFSGTGPNNGETISIENGLNSNTLTLSFSATAATPGTGTVTVSNPENMGSANGDTVTIGSVVYTFEESPSSFSGEADSGSQYYCQDTVSPCVWWGSTNANQAQALYAAITNDPSACPTPAEAAPAADGVPGSWPASTPCYANITAPNPGVTATLASPGTGVVISLINTTGSTAPFLTTSAQSAFTVAAGSDAASTDDPIPGFNSGSGACTSATAGSFNFAMGSTPTTFAGYVAAAINSCSTSYSAVGATATANEGVVTITGTTLGSGQSFTLGGTASNFTWSGVTAGSNGSNGCSSATTGTFATGSTNAAVASNIAAAINSCNSSYPAVGVTANYTSGNSTFTVTSPAAGPFLTESGSSLPGIFSWGSMVAGTAGTNSCTSSTSGTFAASSSTTTLASNLAAAIAACPAAAGVTATSNGAAVTVTATTAGTGGNSIALGNTLSNFTWSGTNLSGGSNGITSGTSFAYNGLTPTQLAANIAAAINANSTLQPLVTATSSGAAVTVVANTVGGGVNYQTQVGNFNGFQWSGNLNNGAAGASVQPNMYPAKYSFSSTTASCSDFVVYPTGTAGAIGGASIAAFSNLYEGGCTGTVPSTYWAYNTGGMVTTSPVLSLDGTQLAFIQVSNNVASLVLLKWSAESGTPIMPVTLTTQTASAYRTCTAPCMLTLALSGNYPDTYSAPYYDYSGDNLYAGDDNGNLHKFTGAFNGTPAEVTSPWPVNLGGQKLSSPVYDGSEYVIVGDFGGVLHSVIAATGAIYGTTASVGDVIADAPLVDGNAGTVYAFVTTGGNGYEQNDNAVFRLPTDFSSLTSPTAAVFEPVGTGGSQYYLYAGTFDNVYYSSTTSAGNLYVVGNTGTAGGGTLYRIPVTSSSMGTPVAAVTGLNSTLYPFPSPVTEFCNNGASACVASATQTTAGTDYVYFSVNQGATSGCTNATGNGCVLSYNVSNPAAVVISGGGLNVTTPGSNGCWATGGIAVDNSVPTSIMAGASQTYFIGLGTNLAGGAAGKNSGQCNGGTSTTIGATQASQANP